MEVKNVMYAAVGAPVMVARKAGEQVCNLKTKWNEERADYTKAAEKKINVWAAEGEKIVSKISEGKVVEEISSKVDLDQAKEQVTKLRDQLEDMLATWRTSFRPEKADKPLVKTTVEEAVKTAPAKAPATKPVAKKAPAKATPKAAAPKTSTAKATTSPAAAKTNSAKPTKAS